MLRLTCRGECWKRDHLLIELSPQLFIKLLSHCTMSRNSCFGESKNNSRQSRSDKKHSQTTFQNSSFLSTKCMSAAGVLLRTCRQYVACMTTASLAGLCDEAAPMGRACMWVWESRSSATGPWRPPSAPRPTRQTAFRRFWDCETSDPMGASHSSRYRFTLVFLGRVLFRLFFWG